jgi:hypothetical protein
MAPARKMRMQRRGIPRRSAPWVRIMRKAAKAMIQGSAS